MTSPVVKLLHTNSGHSVPDKPSWHRAFAQGVCYLIPSDCPLERDIHLLGRMLFHVPPLCKLNPFYDQLMRLRFWALTYLEQA